MAVTGDLFKGFTFGSISSKDYDVYITQESAYDAPERDVEFIDIAGRSGAYVLDKGRFLNIQVSYRCGIASEDSNVFRERIRSFRNALASQIGYQRLTDDYHDTRYREAIFADGINVEMADRQAGEFTVSFNCKPQRFRTDGESRYPIYEGTTVHATSILNPTRFEAHPLIDFDATADGSFSLGDYTVSVQDALVGVIPLNLSKSSVTGSNSIRDTITIRNASAYNVGDAITLDGFDMTVKFDMRLEVSSAWFTNVSGLITSVVRAGGNLISARLRSSTISFVAGTASTATLTATLNVHYSGAGDETLAIPVTVAYNGNSTITVSVTVGDFASGSEASVSNSSIYNGTVNSSVNTLTETIYLDCETGNAYSIIDGSVVSMNNHVSFGAELPVLPSGVTTITRSGTAITNLGITPRWWEV